MKKFENFVANLEVLKRAKDEDLTNEFIISGIIDKFSFSLNLAGRS